MKKKYEKINYALCPEKCFQFFNRYGYYIYEENKEKLILRKPGTTSTMSFKNVPLELSFDFKTDSTEVFLQYGCWVLFDTGDLKKELKRIVRIIEDNNQKLI